MSSLFLPCKIYTIMLDKELNYNVTNALDRNDKKLYNQAFEEIINFKTDALAAISMTIDCEQYLNLHLTSNDWFEKGFRINISKQTKLLKLAITGRFENLFLTGDVVELYLGNCGIDYFNLEIYTNTLPKIQIEEAAVHYLKLVNNSENTTIYLGAASSLKGIETNQKDMFVYAYKGYKKQLSMTNGKVHLVEIDSEKYQLDF